MKYTNSQKFMSGFPKRKAGEPFSNQRIRMLCEGLGRVHMGNRYICLPSDSAGHATALLMENVLIKAGYRVGRITSVFGFEYNNSVVINGYNPSIDGFCKAATEIKELLKKSDESFLREEIIFVFGLLLCKLSSCDFVILEGMTEDSYSLCAPCAPYDLVIMPTVYEGGIERVKPLCDSIRRGVREVVSGNQRSEIFNYISKACADVGARLYLTAKAGLNVTESGARKQVFDYGGKEGYILKSPSLILCDSALSVIEGVQALRRSGVKLPRAALLEGFASTADTGCFQVISVSPDIIADTAENAEECKMLLNTVDSVRGKTEKLYLCAALSGKMSENGIFSAFNGRNVQRLSVFAPFGIDISVIPEDLRGITTVYEDASECAKNSLEALDGTLLCVGNIRGMTSLRNEIINYLNK